MQLLFSLTKKDFEIQTFRCGGKGGQNVNKVETGVRIIHPASGAIGKAVDTRHQAKNRELAFTRCVTSEKFKAWHKAEVARRLGQQRSIEEVVNEMMADKNLKVEYF
jgi:protein subunit release factor B